MVGSRPLESVSEKGWRCGFANLLRQINQRWWHTSYWWVQSLVMLVLLNGLLAFGLWIDPLMNPGELPPGFTAGAFDVFLIWMSILSVMDVVFIMQGAIVGEKQSGVAAWILSGPVSREAYILSKFVGNAIGLILTVVVLQGLVAYVQISLRDGHLLSPLPFTAALSLQGLYLLFYLSLTLMLGAFFSSRVPVLAISFAVLLSQPFIDNLFSRVLPMVSWALPAKLPELARYAHRGEPLPTNLTIITTLIFSIVFLWVAVWRFWREEF